MDTFETNTSQTLSLLLDNDVAPRIHDQDATLYDFNPNAQDSATHFMGWTKLASEPPTPIDEIQSFADEVIADGLTSVLLIGQGGSSQAPMTLTKYSKSERDLVNYKTIDSDSPLRLRSILSECDLATTLVVVASKSGSTIEPRLLLSALRSIFAEALGADQVCRHLVAITDPGSDLEHQATEEGWRAVFLGVPEVGGRFSALSVFGLVPAALSGLPIDELVESAREAEMACAASNPENPAIQLATFLFDHYQTGRNKLCYYAPRRGRVLGLWIEQLLAESTGKDGQGILPYLEVDPLLLSDLPNLLASTKQKNDRCLVIFEAEPEGSDEAQNFAASLPYISSDIPQRTFSLNSTADVAAMFVIWEYATAMLGWLMKVCPFDQPDVASAKAAVLDILRTGAPQPMLSESFGAEATVEVSVSPALLSVQGDQTPIISTKEALRYLLSSLNDGDYFAINAFLPFCGTGRRQALERIRQSVAAHFGCVSCLEIGPRYLHSTGQLQKGGPNQGVFLILSADETHDIPLSPSAEASSLGALAKAQATGDAVTLSARDRRCVHIHLSNNGFATLDYLAELIGSVLHELA